MKIVKRQVIGIYNKDLNLDHKKCSYTWEKARQPNLKNGQKLEQVCHKRGYANG